jgi:hypothetical protein
MYPTYNTYNNYLQPLEQPPVYLYVNTDGTYTLSHQPPQPRKMKVCSKAKFFKLKKGIPICTECKEFVE